MSFHPNDAPIQDIWNDPDERFGEVSPGDPGAEDCVWCRGGKDMCDVMQPGEGYQCTRQKGHAGNHVACGGANSHSIAAWSQTSDA